MSHEVHAEVAERYRHPDDCPSCGGDQVEVVVRETGEFRYKCRCIECGHVGPSGFIQPAAVMFWNREEREG